MKITMNFEEVNKDIPVCGKWGTGCSRIPLRQTVSPKKASVLRKYYSMLKNL